MVRAIEAPDLAHRRRWFTLVVLCLSLIIIVMDNTILNVALPHLVTDLGASTSSLQWIVDAYTIVFAGLLLTAGSLGDKFSRYRGLALGLTVFGLGSLASAFATSSGMLIATRSVMGIGGAFIMPSTLSILTNVFTDPKERGRAIGVWAGMSALGVGIGPLTGGFLLAHFWWGSVFLVNVPVVAIALIGGYFLIPDSRDPSSPKLDPLGAVLSIAGLTSLLWAVIEAPSKGWSSPPILLGFAVGAMILTAFFLWELRYPSPMLNMHFFKNRRFSAASGAITLTFLALFGSIFLLTQYLQSVLGYSPLKAGAVLVPQAAVTFVAAPTSARIVEKLGSKLVLAFGLLVSAVGLGLITSLSAQSHFLDVIIVTMTLGLGLGFVMAPATESIMGSLPRAKAGVGSAVNDTTRQVGGAVGVAVLGSILASKYRNHLEQALGGAGAPRTLIDQVNDNVGKAVGIAKSGKVGPLAKPLLTAARSGFVDGMHTAVAVAALVCVIAAAGVLLWLPAREQESQTGGGGVGRDGTGGRAGGGVDGEASSGFSPPSGIRPDAPAPEPVGSP